VFLCDGGQLKVLDLGLALASGGSKLVAGGTAAYMAPEQRRGAPEDERTDVFALGVLVHQMITGALPFGDSAGVEMERAPVLHVPGVPGLATLVQRMLHVDPIVRPRDGGEVLHELTTVAQRPRGTIAHSKRASGATRRSTVIARRPPLPRNGR
jgi:serine/threonine protein kinase